MLTAQNPVFATTGLTFNRFDRNGIGQFAQW